MTLHKCSFRLRFSLFWGVFFLVLPLNVFSAREESETHYEDPDELNVTGEFLLFAQVHVANVPSLSNRHLLPKVGPTISVSPTSAAPTTAVPTTVPTLAPTPELVPFVCGAGLSCSNGSGGWSGQTGLTAICGYNNGASVSDPDSGGQGLGELKTRCVDLEGRYQLEGEYCGCCGDDNNFQYCEGYTSPPTKQPTPSPSLRPTLLVDIRETFAPTFGPESSGGSTPTTSSDESTPTTSSDESTPTTSSNESPPTSAPSVSLHPTPSLPPQENNVKVVEDGIAVGLIVSLGVAGLAVIVTAVVVQRRRMLKGPTMPQIISDVSTAEP